MNNDLNFPPIFERLVLGCIDADCCRCIFVGGLLARSTRFTYFCTAQIYKFQLKIANNFPRLNIEFTIFDDFCYFSHQILDFFCEFFL